MILLDNGGGIQRPAAATGMLRAVASEDDVRRRCLAMPGVVERPSWGQPAWFARTLLARIWEPGVLTVKTHEREALHGEDPDTFFWTPHHGRPRSWSWSGSTRWPTTSWTSCCASPTTSPGCLAAGCEAQRGTHHAP